MKKRIAVSVGLVAIGTPAIQAGAAEAPKPWTVSASLRAFYDDNYTTAYTDRQESLGFQVAPQLTLDLPLERTTIVGKYNYQLNWYGDRSKQGLTPDDQSHVFDIDVTQTFSERLTGNVGDEFVIAQEPQLLDPSLALAGRANGDNIRNSGYVGFSYLLTDLLSTSISYNNTIIDYEQSGGNAVNPSLSGLLDRIDHQISAQLGYMLSPTLTAFVGYTFDTVCYTGNEIIGQIGFPFYAPPLNVTSSMRNSYSHGGSVGLKYGATEVLSASASVGIQYTDYYNDPAHTTSLSPSADLNATYNYTLGSTLKLGLTHARNATDEINPGNTGKITEDQESTTGYFNLGYQITPLLTASCNGSAQASTFFDGAAGGETDWIYSLGLGLHYTITEHFGADVSYNYDDVESDIAFRSYHRNRFTLGVSANY